MLSGRCHCGKLTIQFEPTCGPAELPVRLCTCSFCARHRPRYTSDPQGSVLIRAADPALLARYRFGLELGDFLLCGACGVYVAAMEGDGDEGRAVINLNCLDQADAFTGEPSIVSVDGEDAGARRARRARGWTPARLVIG
jgi:hypothetical protein